MKNTYLDEILARAERKEAVGIPAFWFLINVAKLAREVRGAQARYFETRERTDLIEAKRLEGEIDRLLDTPPGVWK